MACHLVAISKPGGKGGATSIVTLLGKDRSLYLQTLSLSRARCLSVCRRTLQCMRFFILGPWPSNECICDLITTITLSRTYHHHSLTPVITYATKSAKQCDRYKPPPSTLHRTLAKLAKCSPYYGPDTVASRIRVFCSRSSRGRPLF